MAFTQTDVEALETAIKSGVKTVAYADRTVTYHSLGEMLQLLTQMRAEVAAGGGASSSCGRRTLGTFSGD